MTTTTLPGLVIAPAAAKRIEPVFLPETIHAPIAPAGDAQGIDEDPFHDPLLYGIGIVAIILLVIGVALGGLMHWGVMYHAPSWSANSFPPPVVH